MYDTMHGAEVYTATTSFTVAGAPTGGKGCRDHATRHILEMVSTSVTLSSSYDHHLPLTLAIMEAYTQDKSRSLLYDLAGAIVHAGPVLREGHYKAFAKVLSCV